MTNFTTEQNLFALQMAELENCAVVPAAEKVTSNDQVAYFKFLCHKYAISVHIPKTSRESRIKITAILKGIKSGRVQLRTAAKKVTGYEGRDAECLVGAINYSI